MLTRLQDCLIRLRKRCMTQVQIPPRKSANLLMSTPSDCAAFYAHELEIGNKMRKRTTLTRRNNKRTMQTLLPLRLLEKKMIPAVAAKDPLSST
ncbi:hypothetical protein A3H90_01685 [Candidatus Peribacteria bacterium RIFCSPLOWO2_02_FULL_55_36]|nr:MAG: hypothetical protein A2789_00915 [Candidatus Peribacteria bacterium RIFCSPHIGHO2_01_FULL_54_22]OGJ62194.1 MAG: hypothetical protein A3D12_00030 [Candidatus Peribacteria bacterium RIFCSPHIGHO2_02_FULL_55_24]OGJ63888.1 MAG: hypothetical protein A3E47_00655 [Candidatus Peribacteria bacterium RIFCSPHIGHO2_12_FULL_54_10]OGJ69832.1 MAG: hypothetical protein A3H90_01685 [Candidatus Peribacteria bacterium RIFCSPLOWO2_02_FULL_55_36]